MFPLVTGKTRILGLIADPVAQARTLAMANMLLEQRAQFGAFVLLPMHVSERSLPVVIDALRHVQNFGGAVISMPHKTAIASMVDELMPQAELVGAVNVMRRNSDGRLIGTVLDGEGFVAGLVNTGHQVSGADCCSSAPVARRRPLSFRLQTMDALHFASSIVLKRKPLHWPRASAAHFQKRR